MKLLRVYGTTWRRGTISVRDVGKIEKSGRKGAVRWKEETNWGLGRRAVGLGSV